MTVEGSEQKKGPATFDVAAYSGGHLVLPNFDLPVVVDLATLRQTPNIMAHLDHDRSKRTGHVTETRNDGKSLGLSGVLWESEHSREVVRAADSGFKWQASIEAVKDGGTVERIPTGKQVSANGQTFKGPINVARDFILTGFSFVPHGADATTHARIAAEAANLNPKEGTMTTTLEAPERTSENPQLDTIIQASRLENQRIDAIARLTESALTGNPRKIAEIEAMSRLAVENKWNPERYELELLRNVNRPQAHTTGRSNKGAEAKVLECALAKSCDVQNIEAHYNAETLEAAHAQFRHGIGLQEVLHITARERGYRGTSVKSDLEEALHYACDKNIQASGFSTVSLPTILGNVANLVIKEGFNFVESEWKKICARKTVTNFFEHTSATLTGDMTFEKVGPNGELKHGKVGEETYGNKAETYGKMFALTRRDWVNDNVGALSGIRTRIGRGAALGMNDAFWTEFLNNLAFFSTGNSNYDEGADTAFSADALTLADILFRAQVDPDGKPLGAAPKKLVVPPQYRIAALKLMSSQQVMKDSDAGTDNPWAGMFDVVSSVYMSNSSYPGYSAKKWYLIADPNDMPVIEVALLNGKEMPTVESAAADFDVLGIQFRGFHDYGFRKQEKRGGVAMKGEV